MGDVKQLDLGSIGRVAGLMPGSSVLAADDQPGLSSCDCVVASCESCQGLTAGHCCIHTSLLQGYILYHCQHMEAHARCRCSLSRLVYDCIAIFDKPSSSFGSLV